MSYDVSYELIWLQLEMILMLHMQCNAKIGMRGISQKKVTNLLKTTLTCTAYALVIGKNSADVWTAAGQEGSWFVSARDAA